MSGILVCAFTVFAAWFVQVWIMGMVDAEERRSLLGSFVGVKGIALVPTVMVLIGGCAQDAQAYTIGALDSAFFDCEGDSEDGEDAVSDAVIGPEKPDTPSWYAMPHSAMMAIVPRRFSLMLPVLKKVAKGEGLSSRKRKGSGASNGRVSATSRPTSWLHAFAKKM